MSVNNLPSNGIGQNGFNQNEKPLAETAGTIAQTGTNTASPLFNKVEDDSKVETTGVIAMANDTNGVETAGTIASSNQTSSGGFSANA